MRNVILAISALALINSVLGVSVHFQDCGTLGSYFVDEIFLEIPCKKQPCWFPLKRQTNITVAFKSSNTVALDVIPEVYFIVGNTKLKVDLIPLACPKDVCPIHAQEKKKYSVIAKPNLTLEPTKAQMYWHLYNQKHDKLFCVYFPVIIYNPETHHPASKYRDSTIPREFLKPKLTKSN